MLIVPLMAGHDREAQTIFDGLWRYALKFRSCVDDRLMVWIVPNGNNGCVNATDGDLDIAYGLLIADAQWGSNGRIDYLAAARRVIAGLVASNVGPSSRLPLLGDWVQPNGRDINQWTPRPSDFVPTHFRAFRQAGGGAVWDGIRRSCQEVVDHIQSRFSAKTGLLPDFIQPVSANNHMPRPASPNFHEGPHDGHYAANAGRVPWRLGTDALLHNNRAALGSVRPISSWIEGETGGNPQRIRAGYDLDGRPLPNSNFFSTFFAAPFGVAAMTQAGQQRWLNNVYDAVRARPQNYYEDNVALLCLLVMTGTFWDATT